MATRRRPRRTRRATLEALLREAGFDPRPMEEAGPPAGFELGPVTAGGPEAVAFEAEEGVTLGLKVPLPQPCEVAGLAPTAERTLKLLGAMALGLQSQGLMASPIARYRGLEGLLLSVHVCRPLRGAAVVQEALARLRRTAHALARALSEPSERLLVAVRQACGVRRALAAPSPLRALATAQPAFDAQAERRQGRRRRRTR